ncbi:MAG: methyltransferase domain-containing protein [Burkholderiales bacterium]|nr:methyltransferase domain-containing protein [Burkholderiales bacterium]
MRGGPLDDPARFLRAFATNQLARISPAAYVKLTGQTGRGEAGTESAESIAAYFRECFEDYARELDVPLARMPAFLEGKVLLEYGPGDLPGVALLMYAHGARKVYCVDRFPLVALSDKNRHALALMVDGLPSDMRARAAAVSRGQALDANAVEYIVRADGLSGLDAAIDFVFSRAVLEHVNDLDATFRDMARALRPGGRALHQVDLKSHGLHKANRLDFLTWRDSVWDLMYSGKGFPNRHRVDRYREAIARAGLAAPVMRATELARKDEVDDVRPQLAARFRGLSDDELAWLGFWLATRMPE